MGVLTWTPTSCFCSCNEALFTGISGGSDKLLQPNIYRSLLWRLWWWRWGGVRKHILLSNNNWTGVCLPLHIQRCHSQRVYLERLLNPMVQHSDRRFWEPRVGKLRRLCERLPRCRSPTHQCSHCCPSQLQVREGKPSVKDSWWRPNRGE